MLDGFVTAFRVKDISEQILLQLLEKQGMDVLIFHIGDAIVCMLLKAVNIGVIIFIFKRLLLEFNFLGDGNFLGMLNET
ncbi:hypothetical protein BHOIPH791_12670 [Bartonella henselae]|nr:hypothetical protein BhenCHDE101_03380 [Bartonella henselae]PNM38367.1 hypothetical protein AL470_002650 [Bartonella henselae str. Houston-1]OLL42209.1 hypothetical protein AT237_04540 [Bartonella henselae]OLL47861.1 hypothetical protein AT242_04730 [Bartonella henselae]OLL54533.1 hypothetical protein AT238_05445 [Bartonella henselae]